MSSGGLELTLAAELSARAAEFFSFEYAFARDALIAAVLVGSLCGLLGTVLVLRNMALLGDAAGHATLPGVGAAFLLVGAKHMDALLVGALATALLAAGAVSVLSRGKRSRPDAAVGIVLSVFFGAGIVLLSYVQSSPTAAQTGLQSFLYGNAAAVTAEQLVVLGVVAAVLTFALVAGYRPLSLVLFDEGFARSRGVPVSLVQAVVLAAVTLTIVVSIQAVGVVLVSAMLILPPSAALLVAKRLPAVLSLSALMGAVAGALGAFASYLLEGFGTGPTMVIAAAVIFALALVFGRRGLLARRWGARVTAAEARA